MSCYTLKATFLKARAISFFLPFSIFLISFTSAYAQPAGDPLFSKVIFPYDNYVTDDTTIVFSWIRAEDPTSYLLEVTTDSLFQSGLSIFALSASDTSFTITCNIPQTYYHRLKVLDTIHGTQFISIVQKFTLIYPPSIPGLICWFAADKSGGINNTTLQTWNDLSSNGNHVTNINSAQQPLFLTNRISGKPSLYFDGVNDYFSGSLMSTGTSFDIFLVSTLGKTYGPFYNGNANSNGYGFYRLDTNFYGGLFGGIANLKFGPVIRRSFQIQEFTHVPGLGGLWVNGNKSGNYVSSNPQLPSGSTFVGGINPTSSFKGEMSEILFYNQQLSSNNKSLIYKYLHDKYAPPPVEFGYVAQERQSFCPFTITVNNLYSSYQWSNGSSGNTATISSSGWIKLTVTDLFDQVSMDSIYIIYPNPDLHDTMICKGDSLLLDANLEGEFTYLWLGPQQDTIAMQPGIYVKAGGIYSVIISDTSGCFINRSLTITVDSLTDQVSLGNDTSLCSSQTLGLLSLPPGTLTYLWSTGSTDPNISINTTGDYVVTVTNQNHCTATDTIQVTVNGVAPVVDFNLQGICLNETAVFDGLVLSDDTIISWNWSFGDGDSALINNVSHTYVQPGNYEIRLKVLALSGCSNILEKTISVFPVPEVILNLDSNCQGIEKTFAAEITFYPPDTIESWLWDFGDGAISYLPEPVHSYSSEGEFAVSLQIITGNGCINTAFDTIVIVASSFPPGAFQCSYPFDNQITTDTMLSFTWTSSRNALYYKLQMAHDSSFSLQSLFFTENAVDTVITCSIPAEGIIFWRVISYNLCNDSAVSSYFHLKKFNPAVLNGLKAWYSADNTNQAVGTAISTWIDNSGNHNDASNPDESQQPILQYSALNNKTAIDFDGLNDILYTPLILSSTEFDLVMVSTLGGKTGPFYLGNANNNGYGFYRNDTLAYGALYGGVSNLKFGTIIRKGYQIQELSRSTGITSHYVNNNLSGPVNTSSPIMPAGQGYIGGIASNQFFKGKLSELFCFNQALTTAERKYVFDYLHHKYGPPPVELGSSRVSDYILCPAVFTLEDKYEKYLWSTGDTTHKAEIQKSGWLSVKVVDIFDVESTDSVYISYPVKDLQDTIICLGDTIALNAWSRSGYSYQWESQDQSVLTYDSALQVCNAGIYRVKITDSYGCYQYDTVVVSVDSFAIQASLGGPVISLCRGEYLALAAGSEDVVAYQWNNGTSGPQVLIEQPGNYSVTVFNSLGCIAEDSTWVNIRGDLPVADFSAADSICLGGTIFFTDLSHPSLNDTVSSITGWHWAFDDNTGSNLQNPGHYYQEAGFHDVTLEVITDSGCISSITKLIYLYPLPVADFLTTQGCTGTAVPFADYSFYPAGKGQHWDWNFGDTASGNLNHASDSACYHIYSSPGSFLVRLIITSSNLCKDTVYRTIEIQSSPDLYFIFSNACEGDSTYFTNLSQLPPWAVIISSSWDFGDGSPLNYQSHPAHQYSAAGNYYVTLTLQTMQCRVSKTLMITVDATPNAIAAVTDLCQGIAGVFFDQSTVTGGTISEWHWDMESVGTSHQPSVTLFYPDTGSYTIKYSVASDKGCHSDTVVYTIEVFPVPSVSIEYTIDLSVPDNIVTFSGIGSLEIVSWLWNFGDGTTSTLADPTHHYLAAGNYLVKVLVQTAHGCQDEDYKVIDIRPPLNDIAVSKVYQSISGDILHFSVDLVNLGARSLVSADLNISMNARPVLRERWTGLLYPDSILRYDFYSGIIQSEGTTSDYYCIEAVLDQGFPEDNVLNNIRCEALYETLKVMELYPNPVINVIYIPLILSKAETVYLNVYNSIGQEVITSRSIDCQKGYNLISAGSHMLTPGLYNLQLVIQGKVYCRQFYKE